MPGSPTIVNRAAERDVVRGFLASAAFDAPAHLVAGMTLTGDVGIGKTILWLDGVEHARALGYTVFTGRCFEEDMTGSLVGLADLFSVVQISGEDRAGLVAPDLDPIERGKLVLSVLAGAARSAPLLLAIDDIQWLGDGTATALRYALRRLDRPTRVLATSPNHLVSCDALALRRSLAPGATSLLEVAPLSRHDIRRVLGRRVISPLTLRSIYRVSEGNPLYAMELARTLTENERRVGVSDGWPLPPSLGAAIDRSLADLRPRELRLLECLAVTGPTSLGMLESLDPEVVTEVTVGWVHHRGIVLRDEDLRLRFAHPLWSSAVQEQMNPFVRRTLHARCAEVFSEPAVRTRHLALAADQPDLDVAAELEIVAGGERRRGAPGLAAALFHHSIRLTPPGHPETAHRRRLLEATSLAAAGEVRRASVLLDAMLATLAPGPARAEVVVQRFYVENDSIEAGDAMLSQALSEAGDDPTLQARLRDLIGWHRGVFGGDLPSGQYMAATALSLVDADVDPGLWAQVAGHLAHMSAMAGDPDTCMMRTAARRWADHADREPGGGPRQPERRRRGLDAASDCAGGSAGRRPR